MKHDYIDQNQIVDRYVMNKLQPDEAQAFEDHYLHCTQCQDDLELSETLSMGLALTASASAERNLLPVRPGLGRRYAQFLSRPAVAAAASVVMVGALTSSILSLRTAADLRNREHVAQARLESALTPQSNTPIISLSPVRTVRSADNGSLPELVLDEQLGWIVLAMEPSDGSFPRYRAALRAADASTLWRTDDLILNENFEVILTVHGSLFVPGAYSMQIEGLRTDDSWATVGNYAFTIARP